MPPGWVDTGATLVIEFRGGKPVSLESHAKDGTVRTLPMGADGKEILAQETCRLGGLAAVLDPHSDDRKDGPATVHVARPGVVDEKADLALLCAGPPDPRITADFDPAQTRTLAVVSLRERLGSPRWRGWIFGLARQASGADDATRAKLFADKAAELAAAGAPADCWFAKTLVAR